MRSMLTGLEAAVEVAWVLWVDAEGIHRALWVSLGVCAQPLFCYMCQQERWFEGEEETYL